MRMIFAAVPEWIPVFTLVCLVVALIALAGLALLLRGFRTLSSGVAEIVRRELQAKAEPSPVAVQQPLSVKEHDPCAPLSQVTHLREAFTDLIEQRRKDVSGLHTKIENGLQQMRTDIAGDFSSIRDEQTRNREQIAVLKSETTSQTQQLTRLDGKMDRVLERLPRNP